MISMGAVLLITAPKEPLSISPTITPTVTCFPSTSLQQDKVLQDSFRKRRAMLDILASRSNTNYTPTPLEIQALQTEISGPQRRIHSIERQIQRHTTKLRELERERDVLEAQVNAHRGMLGPARRLLPEIIQEIFLWCLPARNPVMSSTDMPLLLGRVCRQWRNISYATPSLWSAIHIAVPSNSRRVMLYACEHAVRIQAIVEWLSRSGVCPLFISLCTPYCFSEEDEVTNKTVQLYLEAIIPFLPRCKSLYISCRNSSWSNLLMTLRNVEFPWLQCIHLVGRESEGEAVIECMKPFGFQRAPLLHQVAATMCGSRALQIPFRWGQLTELTLCELDAIWDYRKAFLVPDALLILSWCPSLKFCNIPIAGQGASYNLGSVDRTSTLVSLPELVGFTVQCNIDPQAFFINLATPSLRYFRYHQTPPLSSADHLNREDRALHRSLIPFIRRVVQPIEELELLATYLTAGDTISCLELFPGLTRLSLQGLGSAFAYHGEWNPANQLSIGKAILERFTRPQAGVEADVGEDTSSCSDEEFEWEDLVPNGPCLCPKLQYFHCSGASFPSKTLLRFIRFRSLSYAKNAVARLIWARVSFPLGRNKSPGITKKLDDLRKQTGMYLMVHYPESWNWGRSPPIYSPYTGLISVDANGVATDTYNPTFGLILLNDGR